MTIKIVNMDNDFKTAKCYTNKRIIQRGHGRYIINASLKH